MEEDQVEKVARALRDERVRVRRENDAALAVDGLWADSHKQPTDEQYACAAITACNPNDRLSQEVEELKHDLERQMSIANIECNEANRLREALEGGTISQTSFDGHAVRIDFETRAEANELFARLTSALSPLPQGDG